MAMAPSAQAVLQFLMGLSAGAASPAAVLMGGGPATRPGRTTYLNLPGRDDVGTGGYPEEFAPEPYHYHNVVHIPGAPNLNQHGKADMPTIDEAGMQQTLKEHNDLLTKYVKSLPANATPRQVRDALELGRQEEKNYPKWWNESKDRRPFSVSSSAVSGIRITPEGNVEVQWASKPGTWYTFRKYANTHLASKAAQELLKADSIGRAVMPYQRNGKPLKFKDPSMAWWNRKNYEAGYAK